MTPKAAEAVAPGFDFPFYGHVVSKFYITTHGFLSFAPRNGCQLLRCDEIKPNYIIMKLLITICILATLPTLPPRLHNLMYKTQYIAPLRVKLDPARSDDATINYLSQPDRDVDAFSHCFHRFLVA